MFKQADASVYYLKSQERKFYGCCCRFVLVQYPVSPNTFDKNYEQAQTGLTCELIKMMEPKNSVPDCYPFQMKLTAHKSRRGSVEPISFRYLEFCVCMILFLQILYNFVEKVQFCSKIYMKVNYISQFDKETPRIRLDFIFRLRNQLRILPR